MHQQQQQQQQQPPAAMSQQSYAWQQQQQQQYQPPFLQGPHHQQPNPWSSWGRPPHQQQRGRAHNQRTPRHRGGHQAHQQRVMYTQCGKEKHFPADCVITMPPPAPQHTVPFSGLVPRSTVPEPMPHSSTAPELMSHSTALTPFLPGHQATAIINRPIQPTDLRQIKPVLYQPSRCHRRRPYLSGRHLYRPLLRILIGASLPDHPKLYRHNTCLQASFRVRV